ncbi:MAG: LuxR C-terminal-related transcriptional regulator, partial [Meiothermus silvanus]|nr:LuxR C-terminal-related transcriptional regulator [Allomeiothermus silvanus]
PRAVRALTQKRDSPPVCSSSLTEREHEVLSLLAQGLTNRKIAARLHISHATVKTHVSSILAKLGTEAGLLGAALTAAVEVGEV